MNYNEINNWLEGELKKLDISPTNYQKAVDRYTSVGNVLESKLRDEYNIDSHVYAQGSFMIGTVVKPYGKDKEYDVDIVCECDLTKNDISAKELKETIGNIIRNDGIYGKMLSKDEGRRTWTIEYAEDSDLSFHIDVQPSIPKDDSQYEKAISTTTRSKKDNNDYYWDNGNPLGFKDWFEDANANSYNEVASLQKRILFENNTFYASVDDIPKQLVVTKLQRLVQILKRHRDIRFENHKYKEDKPNSMIITILATKVFLESSSNLSLIELLKLFSDKLTTNLDLFKRTEDDITGLLIDRIDGDFIINNPKVEENLAERWNDSDNDKKQAFFDWVSWISTDIQKLASMTSLMEYEHKSFDNLIKEYSHSKAVALNEHNSKPRDLQNNPKPWKENV